MRSAEQARDVPRGGEVNVPVLRVALDFGNPERRQGGGGLRRADGFHVQARRERE